MHGTDTVWLDHLFIDLDRTGPVPLYHQIASRLEKAIRSGELPAGSRLENEVSIVERLGISRPTVRRAIQELVDMGLLVRRRGVGTQVIQSQLSRQVALTSLYEDLENTSRHPGTRVLVHEVVPASPRVAQQLGIEAGSDVVHLRRQRTADGIPSALLENYLPGVFSDIPTKQFEELGLYQILASRGIVIRVANQRLGAKNANLDESTLLEVQHEGALITMERVAYDGNARAVEYGQHCYRPDMYSFETTLVAK